MTSRQQQLTGPERWQISYADLLTLLLGFFIVMYAVASMEADKKAEVITALQTKFSTFKADEAAPAGSDYFASDTASQLPDALLVDTPFKAEAQGEWLYLEVAAETVFESGSAELKNSAKKQLDALAAWLMTTEGPVEIEGHTDNQPISTARFPNNWALSSARAVAIVNYLIATHSLEGARFRAVGFGEFAPVADNSTPAGRQENRRVVIKVENRPIYLAPADSATVSDTANNSAEASTPSHSGASNRADDSATTEENIARLAERLKEKGIDPSRKPRGGLKFSDGQ
ncbi:MAG TPA: OmpA family protein [Marinagarivorans sp.]